MIKLKKIYKFSIFLLSIQTTNANEHYFIEFIRQFAISKKCSYEYYVQKQLRGKGNCSYKKINHLYQWNFSMLNLNQENNIYIEPLHKNQYKIQLQLAKQKKTFFLEEDKIISTPKNKTFYYRDNNKKKILILNLDSKWEPIIVLEYGKIIIKLQ